MQVALRKEDLVSELVPIIRERETDLKRPHDGCEPRESEQGGVHGEVRVVGADERRVGEVVLDHGDRLGAEPDRVGKLDDVGLEFACGARSPSSASASEVEGRPISASRSLRMKRGRKKLSPSPR